jgi:hypothetical protein
MKKSKKNPGKKTFEKFIVNKLHPENYIKIIGGEDPPKDPPTPILPPLNK